MNNFTVPKPCHENWENMLPEEKGRFCTACKTKVYDFTKSSDQEIQEIYDLENGNICGKFESKQLLHFTKFQNAVLRIERFTQNHFSKFGILVSAVSLLMSISGCNKNGKTLVETNDTDSTNYYKEDAQDTTIIGEFLPQEDSAQIPTRYKKENDPLGKVVINPGIKPPIPHLIEPTIVEVVVPQHTMGVPIYVEDTTKVKIESNEGIRLGKIVVPPNTVSTKDKNEVKSPQNFETREIEEVRVVGMVKKRN